MKQYSASQLKTKLTSIAAANNTASLQEVFANVVYNGLVHNNIMAEQMKALRDSAAPAKLKAGLAKHMPMTWNKKAERYEFSTKKAETLRLELGIEFRESTIEQVAEVLPELFAKVEREQVEFNLDDYLAKVATKLDKEGVQDADSIIAIAKYLSANPDKVADAMSVLFEQQLEAVS